MPKLCHDWEGDPRSLQDCLIEWIAARGIDHREAAETLGVNPTSLHNWRYGGRPCSFEKTLRKLMTALDRLPDDEPE